MTTETILITGANGEISHSLITELSKQDNVELVALDLNPIDESLIPCCCEFVQGNILDEPKLADLFSKYHFTTIYHLASILSTQAEIKPNLAQKVNVQGTANLLELAAQQSSQFGYSTKFIYPSSIAVYGLMSIEQKIKAGHVHESEYTTPITLYGCNKLACEQLGNYYDHYYRLLDQSKTSRIDFRSIRFPGLISAITVPTGGTSDYGPEMLHHAAQSLSYGCFVRPDSRLPFMVMPDAVRSLLLLAAAPKANLSQTVYNVTSFNPSAEELKDITLTAFPSADISYEIHPQRQRIVDSWPADIDDSAARNDWQWLPDYNLEKAFQEYLIPMIRSKYN